MRLHALIAAVLCAACAGAAHADDRSRMPVGPLLDSYKGAPVQTLIARLGKPDERTAARDGQVLFWRWSRDVAYRPGGTAAGGVNAYADTKTVSPVWKVCTLAVTTDTDALVRQWSLRGDGPECVWRLRKLRR